MIITNKPVDCKEFADLLRSKAKRVRNNDEGVAGLLEDAAEVILTLIDYAAEDGLTPLMAEVHAHHIAGAPAKEELKTILPLIAQQLGKAAIERGIARLTSRLDIMHGETVVRAVMLVGKGREDGEVH